MKYRDALASIWEGRGLNTENPQTVSLTPIETNRDRHSKCIFREEKKKHANGNKGILTDEDARGGGKTIGRRPSQESSGDFAHVFNLASQ